MSSLLNFISGLGVIDFILLLSSVVALLPTFPLISLFLRTRISEYLLFCAVFLSSSVFALTSVIARETNLLLFWQLSFSARNITYFLFFLHLVRMLWYRPPLAVQYTGVIGYAFVQGSLLLWRFNSEGVPGLFLPDGTDIYSTEHRLLANLFQLYVALLFLYGYHKVQVVNPSTRVRNTKVALMTMAVLLVASRLYRVAQNFGLPQSAGTEVLGNLLIVIGFLVVGMVFILYPESIMLTSVQLSAVVVLSKAGVPVAAIRFKESAPAISPMLLGGIMTAVETILSETMGEDEHRASFHQLLTRRTSLLIYRNGNFLYAIITRKNPTSLQRSSLRFFAKEFSRVYHDKIEQFYSTGEQITDLSEVIETSFPYSSGLTAERWN